MKAQDLLTHIERLGATVLYCGVSKIVFKLSKSVRLFLYDDESWELKTHDIHDGTINILNDEVMKVVAMTDQELTTDLLSIIHVFSCRLHGLRNYKSKIREAVSDKRTEEDPQKVV